MPERRPETRVCQGVVASNSFVPGMIVTMWSTLMELTTDDILLLSTPNGGYLTLYPESISAGAIVVTAMVKPVEYRQFVLKPLGDRRWYLQMNAHDTRLQQSGNF